MKTETRKPAVCPKCGQIYNERPSLSRIDNITLICPDCGTREALESIGVNKIEQQAIINTLHNCTRNEH